jgi:hypothetical protein
MYASAQSLDFLAWTKNPSFPNRKLLVSHPVFPDEKPLRFLRYREGFAERTFNQGIAALLLGITRQYGGPSGKLRKKARLLGGPGMAGYGKKLLFMALMTLDRAFVIEVVT